MNSIDRPSNSHQEFRRSIHLSALETYLTDTDIETVCSQLNHGWRDRLFPPGLMVRSMVYRGLSHDRSIDHVLTALAALDPTYAENGTDSAWCQARHRLPQGLWAELIRRSADRAAELAGQKHLYRGRRVYIVDGTTVSMPDTPDLVDAFGKTRTRHGPSRFPVARLTLLAQDGLQTISNYRLDPYTTDEDTQFHRMWASIPPEAVCLADRKFSSFYNLAKLQLRGVDLVSRLHSRRSARRLIEHGKKIGKNQWLVTLHLAPQLRKRYADPTLPESLDVRLIRVWFYRGGKRHTLWLVTTLLDVERYPAKEIVQLYRQRWMVETRIGSIKTILQMNVLRSKTESSVRSEVAATILAHNLVWLLIHQAAEQSGIPPDRISFASAVKIVTTFSNLLAVAGRARKMLYSVMLDFIAQHTNRHRPGRVEPRLVKREPVRFAYLRTSRDQARAKCLTKVLS